jgi:hypothetical protein
MTPLAALPLASVRTPLKLTNLGTALDAATGAGAAPLCWAIQVHAAKHTNTTKLALLSRLLFIEFSFLGTKTNM